MDIKSLRANADHSPRIERQMVWLFMATAERCLGRMQGLVVRGDSREWQSVVHELGVASAHIHAEQLTMLCKCGMNGAEDAVSRLGAYLQIKEAYEGLLIHLRNADLLTRTAQQD